MKTKVLIVSTVGLAYDGITSVILSYLEAMDLSNLDIYIVSTIKCELNIRKRIESLGCKIIDLPSRKKRPLDYFFVLIKIIRKYKIQVIHAHGNSATLTIEMLAALLGGCKKRIAHSHSTHCEQIRLDKILRPFFKYLYTDAVACGVAAGKWLFGNKPYIIMSNGRDVNKYRYNENVRREIRERLQIGDAIAVGHVGGFVDSKNHEFLLEIYKQLSLGNSNMKFYMIGDGYLRKNIEDKARDLGISDKSFFLGNIDWVPEVLSALDVMILPSKYEGVPLAAIEWQISGLPCLLSDVIVSECVFADNVEFLSLAEVPETWCQRLLAMDLNGDRNAISECNVNRIRNTGFDIIHSANEMKLLYSKK